MKRESFAIPIVMTFLALCLSASSWAVDDTNQKALAKAQFLLRQVNAEKNALQQQLSESNKELEDFKKAAEEDEEDNKKAIKRIAKLENALEQWKASHKTLKESLGGTKQELGSALRNGEELTELLEKHKQNFRICYSNNQALTRINHELLDRYKNKGFWDVVGEKDPVTGFESVRAENVVQDYQFEIEDHDLSLNPQLIQNVDQSKD